MVKWRTVKTFWYVNIWQDSLKVPEGTTRLNITISSPEETEIREYSFGVNERTIRKALISTQTIDMKLGDDKIDILNILSNLISDTLNSIEEKAYRNDK